MSAFDKIIGYSSIKKELIQISDTIKNMDAYKKLGVTAPRGLLLHGEPGVGKSLMASSLIEESGRKAYIIRKTKPDGDFVKEIKATFDEAMANEPSIVFLDDMDKFTNGDERHPDAEEYVTVQACIDEAKGHEVFVLATVNNMRCLPRSLTRAGRFDRVVEIEAPHGKDAELIVAHYLSQKKFVKDIDAKTIARLLNNESCAVLETVINEAGLYAGYERAEAITMDHFMKACMKTVFDMPRDDEDYDDDDDYSTDLSDSSVLKNQIVYHEAGHAVISEVLCPESVTLVAIRTSGGNGRGGFTHYYNDLSYTPLTWNKSRIVGALGGIAAIDQVFGIQDPGGIGDLNHAFGEVRDLISDSCVCGFHLYSRGYGDSEKLMTSIEQATAAEVERYYKKAKEIIALNYDFFNKIAEALAKKGILSMADIQEIKSTCKITPVSV